MTTPSAPELTLRPEAAGDIGAIRALTTAAFDQPAEAEIVDALRESGNGIEGLSIVGIRDGEIIAHAMLSRCFVGDAPGVCLAPCSVSPDRQRGGTGSLVIEALLAEAARRGEDFAVVLGHPEYYPRFGFTPASGYGVTLHVDVPDEALMAMPLAGDVPDGSLAFAPEFGV
ncbi:MULTISPECIES: N-acetyltransferase [unclassified Brevibacterium]|uniref:GNAT family N-acetyltransferase n=1 Tax=unclassified Brevibacterium TaxID=2614124 RepID=UPI001E5B7EB8|nr:MULTISPECIES: N-acetyltransferase [unclassified Brevibacterium]MDK8434307.1 N-acetyltransferase [Brevibacterium sp. H-BE7]